MQLSKDLHDRLAAEFRFAADKMGESEDPRRKLYFFSAFYGEIGRILNWTWDRDLALMHMVLQNTYQQIHARTQLSATGADRAIRLSGVFYEALTMAANDLAEYVEKEDGDQDLRQLLGRFSELSYFTTGNGQYLFEKGVLRL